MLNQIACLIYGALTILLAFAAAALRGDTLSMGLVVIAAALTYIFQTIQEFTTNAAVLAPLWLVIGVLVFVSAVRILGAY